MLEDKYVINSRIRERSLPIHIHTHTHTEYVASVNKDTYISLNSTTYPEIVLCQIFSRISFHFRFVEFDSAVCARNWHNRVCFVLPILRASNAGAGMRFDYSDEAEGSVPRFRQRSRHQNRR